MHVGATLRLLRTARGMSLNGLAAEVGVSPAYISRVEHGHDAPPTADRLRAIALALGVSSDALTDLVAEFRPDAADWLGHSAAGRHLAAELRRRALGPAQLARVTAFVASEFPVEARQEGVAALFTVPRVLHGVSVSTLRDALDVAAVRLVARDDLARVAAELAAQGYNPSGAPPCAIGGGLCVAYARAPGATRGVLLLLVHPLPVVTPDRVSVRAVVVLVGADEATLIGALVRVAQIASANLVERLAESPSAAAALGLLP